MNREIALLNKYWTDLYFALHYTHEEPLTHQAIRLLQLIEKTGSRSIGEIAAYLKISHNTASEHVKKLVAKGYLLKTRSPVDERKVVLQLTQVGEKVLQKNTSLDEEKLGKIWGAFSAEEKSQIINSFRLLSERAK